MNHYCFSISWPKILPDGSLANINLAGIEFYRKLIKGLLRNHIEPVVTMMRFDVPQTIQNLGGFTNKVVVDYFEAYANVLFTYFGDLVKRWITFDEPSVFCNLIYANDYIAPTAKSVRGIGEYLCGHNVLKAHAIVYELYQRRYAKRCRGKVGIVLYANFYYLDTGNEYDVKKALDFEAGHFFSVQ